MPLQVIQRVADNLIPAVRVSRVYVVHCRGKGMAPSDAFDRCSFSYFELQKNSRQGASGPLSHEKQSEIRRGYALFSS